MNPLLTGEVLGLTFTAKAAGELAERVRGALAALAPSGVAGDEGGEPTVSTYHAYAGALVRDHGLRVGVEPDSRVLADATRFQLAGAVVRGYPGPLPALRHAPAYVVPALVSLDAECSDHLADPAEVRAWCQELAPELEAKADEVAGAKGGKGHATYLRKAGETARRRADLCLLVAAYRAEKRRRDCLDFGDQISLGVRIAQECPEVATAERDRYRAVLLDEYQDTSVAQRQLLAAMFGGGRGVTAVGDPCQAIYGWRGASVDNLVRFGEHFGGTRMLALTTSQRSGGRLLTLANRVSAPLQARHPVAVLRPRDDLAELGVVVVARHAYLGDELAWMAGQVADRITAGTPAGEIAVLLRTWRNVGEVHAALGAAGVPVEVVGLGGLLALPEVADVVAVLELLDNPTANAALLRLLAGPRWRLGARDVQALGVRARQLVAGGPDPSGEVDPLEEAANGSDPCDLVALSDVLLDPGPRVSAEARERLQALGFELRDLRRHAGEQLPDLVSRVIASIGLDVEVAASPEAVAGRQRESLAAFGDVVAAYAGLDGEAGLRAFLAYLRAADDFDRGFDAALPTAADAVQLLSMHKAKGLEWDVVVLPDLTERTFPGKASDRWPTALPVLPARFRSDASSLPADPDWDSRQGEKAYLAATSDHDALENDRLAYVAMTRARHTVIASTSVWGLTQKKPRQPSRYLTLLREHAEAGNGTVETWEPDADPAAQNPYLVVPDLVWPAPLDPGRLADRRAAATLVLGGLDDPDEAVGRADAGLGDGERAAFADLDTEAEALLAEARAARVGVVEVPLPATLTASQVLALRASPDGLARSIARPLPARPVPAARRGTAFHSWVERRFAMTAAPLDLELPGAADEGIPDDELTTMQEAFLASVWADRPPHAVEAPFAVLLGGRLVRGRIDAVYDLGGGRWQVVDWKTGTGGSDPLQLAVYRTAWARQVGCAESDVEASFVAIRTGVTTSPPLPTGAELETLIAYAGPR